MTRNTPTLKSQVLAVLASDPDARFTAIQFARTYDKAGVYFSAMLSQLYLKGLVNRHDVSVNRHKRYTYSFKRKEEKR